MNTPRLLLATVGATILSLVVADIIGVVACTLFDVAPIRGSDGAALPYVIWFVLGVFTGLTAYGLAEGWGGAKGAGKSAGTMIVAAGIATMGALCVLFWWLEWSRGVEGEYYVPDSMPHTIVFVVAVAGGMILSRAAFTEVPAKTE
jgi:hypothetical protein